MDVTLDFRSGYRRIMTFDLNTSSGGGNMHFGDGQRDDWREDYRRFLDEERQSPSIVWGSSRESTRGAELRPANEDGTARERYLTLRVQYGASSPAEQRELYPALQRAYSAAFEDR